jgi:hypothetical protein
MNFKTTNCGDGDSIELQNDLSASEVEPLGSGVLAVVHNTGATQTTYERRIERDTNPKHADRTVPDGAIVVELRHDQIDFLVEQ